MKRNHHRPHPQKSKSYYSKGNLENDDQTKSFFLPWCHHHHQLLRTPLEWK